MADSQSYKNHTRWDPQFHFFIAPVLLANVIVAVVLFAHATPDHRFLHIWLIVVSLALFMTAGIARGYALKNQDRVIRMEERLRYAMLMTPEQAAVASGLSLKQIVALRFASDAELPSLASRAVQENLDAKAIKQSIGSWRADKNRV